MTTAKAERSLRLLGKKTLELDRQTAASGEIFYDSTTTTLRLYDGVTVGGKVVGQTNIITLANGSVIKDNVDDAISFGQEAGLTNQGALAVAVGAGAGRTNQGSQAVAIGEGAGYNNQGAYAVAIGEATAAAGQGQYAVSIGYHAGLSNQGIGAIAIGNSAGEVSQAANSIVINATGATLNNTTAQSLKISPIRSATATANVLYYNTTSKEVTYAALPTIPTNNNQLTNGAGYITATGIASQTGNSGKYLTTDGTTTSWGTVATLPTQTNNVGRILTTDGTNASWITPASSRLKLLTGQGGAGPVGHTFSEGPVWRHTNIAANFTANFSGVPAVEGTVLTVMLQLVQGVTPYMPIAVQVEGVTAGSILWFGGVSTGNASKTNVVIFTLIRSASTWAVLGEVKSYG